MDGKKVLYYAAIAIAVLIGVSVLVSVVSAVLSLAWVVLTGIVSLAVLAGLVYVAYRTGSWLFGSDDAASTDVPESRRDRLRREYVEGQIDEDEFERRITSELEAEPLDEIDRELERER
jgi:hypothetical protein